MNTQSNLKLSLTKKERRALERAQTRELRRARKTPAFAQLRELITARLQKSDIRPGASGWNRRGGGPVSWFEKPVEYQGTAVQVCGLWPFIGGSSTPTVGVPLGHHLRRGNVFCCDPISWFLANLVNNPSAFVLGRPGLGKSSLIRRMVAVLEAWGRVPMILSDTKPDYVDEIAAMLGQVIGVSPGAAHVNPLDLGSLVRALAEIIDPEARRKALEEMRSRRLASITGLLMLALDRNLHAHEGTILSEALRILDPEVTGDVLISDLRLLVSSRHEKLMISALAQDKPDYYDERVAGLLDGLNALDENGPFGDLFARPTTTHIIPGKPVVFDISGISEADAKLQAAVQLVCWGYGSAAVSAEKHYAKAKGQTPRHYFLIMDEMWRMLRASPQMIYFLDTLTRLNRQMGIGQVMCTHTMKDLKMPDDHLTSIAWGFVERSALVFLGGLAPDEMGNLDDVFELSSAERDLVTDWADEGQADPETGRAAVPPGRGKFIMKQGKRPGVPFRTMLTRIEESVNDTNKAWHQQPAPGLDGAA